MQSALAADEVVLAGSQSAQLMLGSTLADGDAASRLRMTTLAEVV